MHGSCWEFLTTSFLEGAWFVATVNMSLWSEHRHDASVQCGPFDVDHDERSIDAIYREGVRLLRLLGDTESQQVVSNNGPEKKFFLIDREHCVKRPLSSRAGGLSFEPFTPKGRRSV